ncbi:hypothetical protein BDZ97DRAFT_1672536 [Flammula alnicola]|nr:hypothetical protein BDZ97DRAFT_1672536 [Flammula alnicola]
MNDLSGTRSSDSEKTEAGRTIYLPLAKLDMCASCQKTGNDVKLRLCASCGETQYCSPECQKRDWKTHKVRCGTNDRIDLQSYYPFIASIAHVSHIHPDIRHPALNHQIVNSPNPNSGDVVEFPNGVSAKLVILGKEVLPTSVGSMEWWPTGATDKIRHKLLRRITSEGLLLPIVLSIAISLVSEIYTTTAIPPSEQPGWQVTGRRRVRLSYNRSPIADFGIVHGSVPVTHQDRLAYYNIDEHAFLMGQDPTDHYWIYFTTLAGDEYFLDCGMFTFNCCLMVETRPYCRYGMPDMRFSPAFFFGREQEKAMPLMDRLGWKPRKRFSILRESRLADILRSTDFDYCKCHDIPTIYTIMNEIAERDCSDWEKEMMMKFLPNACMIVRLNMQNREYLNFPKEPQVTIETDPGEVISGDSEEDKAFAVYLKKWARKLKKGKISPDQWESAFRAWQFQPYESRMKMAGKAK